MLKAPTGAVAVLAAIVAFAALAPRGLQAQATALQRGSDNIEVLGHLPLGPTLSVSDIDIEQDLARPYAYVGRMQYGDAGPRGLDLARIHI